MALSKAKEPELKVTVNRVSDMREKYNFIALDLEVNGVTIYGCSYREGKNGAFISFPSHQGKDGKYYSYCYCKFTAKNIEDIEKQIEDMLK